MIDSIRFTFLTQELEGKITPSLKSFITEIVVILEPRPLELVLVFYNLHSGFQTIKEVKFAFSLFKINVELPISDNCTINLTDHAKKK